MSGYSRNPFVPMSTNIPSAPNLTHIWNEESTPSNRRSERLPVWNIPSAIPKRFLTPADKEFERKKKLLAHRLPILTAEDIARERFPHHMILMIELHDSGYQEVAKEINRLFRKQEFSHGRRFSVNLSKEESANLLETKRELLDAIVETLKFCWDALKRKQILVAVNIRKSMAENMIKVDQVWIAKHFYETCLELTTKLPKADGEQIKSEIKCTLGYLEMDTVEQSDWSAKVAIGLLEESRELSKNQQWMFHSRIIVLKLRKPINLYGLREEFVVINGHCMTIHSVATLMLNEVLQAKAGSIVFTSGSKKITDQMLDKALNYSERALNLADEFHEPTAVISARMTLGAIFMKKKEFETALTHLTEFQKQASLHSDHEAEAIAFNMIGSCYMELEDAVSAVENFVCQKEVADLHQLPDLSFDALQMIGNVLLSEGQLTEAELCFVEAYHGFMSLKLHDGRGNQLTENCWVKSGISAGLNIWGKIASHCRRNQVRDYEDIMMWKTHRAQPRRISKLPQEIPRLGDVYSSYDSQLKIPQPTQESFLAVIEKAKKHNIIGPDSISDLQEAFRVELDYQKRQDKRKISSKPRVRVRVAGPSNFALSSLSINYGDGSTNDDGSYYTRDPELDENSFLIYESDLRPMIQKKGTTYQIGGSRWTLALVKTVADLDPNDPTRTKRQSYALIPTQLDASNPDDAATFQEVKLAESALELANVSEDDLLLVEVSSNDGVITQAKPKSEFERFHSKSVKQHFHKPSEAGGLVTGKSKHFQSTLSVAQLKSRAEIAAEKMKLPQFNKSIAPAMLGPSVMQMNRLSSSTEKMIKRKATTLVVKNENPQD